MYLYFSFFSNHLFFAESSHWKYKHSHTDSYLKIERTRAKKGKKSGSSWYLDTHFSRSAVWHTNWFSIERNKVAVLVAWAVTITKITIKKTENKNAWQQQLQATTCNIEHTDPSVAISASASSASVHVYHTAQNTFTFSALISKNINDWKWKKSTKQPEIVGCQYIVK